MEHGIRAALRRGLTALDRITERALCVIDDEQNAGAVRPVESVSVVDTSASERCYRVPHTGARGRGYRGCSSAREFGLKRPVGRSAPPTHHRRSRSRNLDPQSVVRSGADRRHRRDHHHLRDDRRLTRHAGTGDVDRHNRPSYSGSGNNGSRVALNPAAPIAIVRVEGGQSVSDIRCISSR